MLRSRLDDQPLAETTQESDEERVTLSRFETADRLSDALQIDEISNEIVPTDGQVIEVTEPTMTEKPQPLVFSQPRTMDGSNPFRVVTWTEEWITSRSPFTKRFPQIEAQFHIDLSRIGGDITNITEEMAQSAVVDWLLDISDNHVALAESILRIARQDLSPQVRIYTDEELAARDQDFDRVQNGATEFVDLDGDVIIGS